MHFSLLLLPPSRPSSLNNSFCLVFSISFLWLLPFTHKYVNISPTLRKQSIQTSKTLLSVLSFQPLIVELLSHHSADDFAEVTVTSQLPDSCFLSSYLYSLQHLRLLNTHSFLISTPTLVSTPLLPLAFLLYFLSSTNSLRFSSQFLLLCPPVEVNIFHIISYLWYSFLLSHFVYFRIRNVLLMKLPFLWVQCDKMLAISYGSTYNNSHITISSPDFSPKLRKYFQRPPDITNWTILVTSKLMHLKQNSFISNLSTWSILDLGSWCHHLLSFTS